MFIQDIAKKPIRDFVFPVGNVTDRRFNLKGTAFFVGDQGIAVTAAHVIDDLAAGSESNPVGLFAGHPTWSVVDILSCEKHMREDVGLLRMDGKFESLCRIRPTWENSARDYDLWGYPERIAHELRAVATSQEEATHLIRPDLIYSRGYIRRRISRELSVSIYRGTSFYEISEVAGSCCSGAPVISRPHTPGQPFDVIGVYIGEETGGGIPHVGYATRCDALDAWIPQMTGTLLKHLPAIG